MKKIFANTILILGLLTLLFINACKDNIDPIIEELNFDRAFTPRAFKAEISSITTLTLTWIEVKNVDHYVVEIYQGTEFTSNNLIATIDTLTTTYVYTLPAGDTQFSARVKAVSSIKGVDDSKWISASFITGKENLFTGYNITMTGIGNITVNWTPGKGVTHLAFINNGTETPYTISKADSIAGTTNLTGVPKGNYEIRIMNGTFIRGKQNYVVEGDVFLTETDDFAAAVSAAPVGGVIILAAGANIAFDGPVELNKSIKIKGASRVTLPTMYLKTLPASLIHMFDLGTGLVSADSVVFQNVNISGLINNVAGSKLRGVFDQQVKTCNVGKIKFDGCIVRNFDRHVLRLRGDVAQTIGSIEFNNCLMYDFAFGSNYGVINSSAANGNIGTIKITNSTIYYIRGALITYSNGTSCQGITINNCSFNQLSQDATTARYIIDMNLTVSTNNISVSNCIFGSSQSNCVGFRVNTMVLNMSNCFYTSDFYDGTTYSAKASMTAYSGASSALWTNPTGGVFTFLDQGFTGKNTTGDPRWKP